MTDTPERVANRFLTSPLSRLPNRLLSRLSAPDPDPDCDDPLLEDCAFPDSPQPFPLQQAEPRPQPPLPPDCGDLEF
jgi:hypothetical protein